MNCLDGIIINPFATRNKFNINCTTKISVQYFHNCLDYTRKAVMKRVKYYKRPNIDIIIINTSLIPSETAYWKMLNSHLKWQPCMLPRGVALFRVLHSVHISDIDSPAMLFKFIQTSPTYSVRLQLIPRDFCLDFQPLTRLFNSTFSLFVSQVHQILHEFFFFFLFLARADTCSGIPSHKRTKHLFK